MGKICSLSPSLGLQTVTWHSKVAERLFGRSVMLKNPERSQQQGLKRVASASVQFAPQEWEVLRAVVCSPCFVFVSHKLLRSSRLPQHTHPSTTALVFLWVLWWWHRPAWYGGGHAIQIIPAQPLVPAEIRAAVVSYWLSWALETPVLQCSKLQPLHQCDVSSLSTPLHLNPGRQAGFCLFIWQMVRFRSYRNIMLEMEHVCVCVCVWWGRDPGSFSSSVVL